MVAISLKLYYIDYTGLFHKPVLELEKPPRDYDTIISNPMDLKTIQGKLNKEEYNSIYDIIKDINLMFSNCVKYNGKQNEVSEYSNRINEQFQNESIIVKT